MEAKSFTIVMISPASVDAMNLVINDKLVDALSDTKWNLTFSQDQKTHFWVAKVSVEDVEQVLSLPAVIYCHSDKDSEKAVHQLLKLKSIEEISQDLTAVAVNSTVIFTEVDEYLGTFILCHVNGKQELKRV